CLDHTVRQYQRVWQISLQCRRGARPQGPTPAPIARTAGLAYKISPIHRESRMCRKTPAMCARRHVLRGRVMPRPAQPYTASPRPRILTRSTERERPMHEHVITSDPAGRPVIAGTQVTVEEVLKELAACGEVDRVLTAHPELDRDAVQAA